MPKGIPLTEEEQTRRRHEIFDAVVPIILEKGFAETSMREIAAAAGVGKSTLYDYFPTKEDVLVFIFEEEFNQLNHMALDIAGMDLPAAERLRKIMHMHLGFLVKNKSLLLYLSQEVQRLSQVSQRRIQVKRHAYQDMLRSLVEQGILEGSFRPVDATMASKILLATMTPVVFTTRPVGTPQEMLVQSLDILLNGLQV